MAQVNRPRDWIKDLREKAQAHRNASYECDRQADFIEARSYRFAVEISPGYPDLKHCLILTDGFAEGAQGEKLSSVQKRAEEDFYNLNETDQIGSIVLLVRRFLVFPDKSSYEILDHTEG